MSHLRSILTGSIVAALFGFGLIPGVQADLADPDGITARILPNGVGLTQEILRPGADGDYSVAVTIYEKGADGVWRQVAQNATLNVYTYGDNSAATGDPNNNSVSARVKVTPSTQVIIDEKSPAGSAHLRLKGSATLRASVPFASKVLGGQTVKFPASSVTNPDGTGNANAMDIVAVFSGAHDGSTSHYSINRNELYNFKQYDAADALDNLATVFPVGLGQ